MHRLQAAVWPDHRRDHGGDAGPKLCAVERPVPPQDLRLPHGHAPPGPVLVPLGGPDGFVLDEDDDPEPVVGDDQEVGPNA